MPETLKGLSMALTHNMFEQLVDDELTSVVTIADCTLGMEDYCPEDQQ